jgi:hypothetical protein
MKRTPLARQSAKKKASGEPSLKRTQLNPVGKKQKADKADMDAVREQVMARHGYRCAIPLCSAIATDLHHRQLRRHGNNTPANLVGLCRTHHSLMDTQRAWAVEWGWVLYSWDNPADTPYGVRRIHPDESNNE